MKSNINTYITNHGGIRRAGIALYRELISSDFFRNVSETFATKILLIAIGVITSVIVARILGPEGRGLYAVAFATAAVGVQFGNLGLHASNTYAVARDRTLLPQLVGNTLLLSFVFGGICAFLAASVLSLWPDLAPIHGSLLVLTFIWVPFGLAYMLSQNLLLGIHEIRAYNKIELLMQIYSLAFIGIVFAFRLISVVTVFAASLSATIGGFIWAFWTLKQRLSKRLTLSLPLFKENIRYGIKAYLAAFFAFLVLRIDLLMVKYMLGAEQAGYYSIAVTMADMVYMLPVVIGTVLFPKLSALSDNTQKWNLSNKVAILVGIVMLITGGLVGLISRPIVHFLYGELFMPAVPAFVWLIPGIVMLSINTIYMNYFASIGMPAITLYSPGVSAILNIALNTKLIPMLGIAGASISSVIAYGAMLAFSLTYIYYSSSPKGMRYGQ